MARTYAAAPQASVMFSPNWMAMTIASTEPSTLDAAFIAHAHSTAPWFDRGSALASAWADKARSPLGKGMPIAKPRGNQQRCADKEFHCERQSDQRAQQLRQNENVEEKRAHNEDHRQRHLRRLVKPAPREQAAG